MEDGHAHTLTCVHMHTVWWSRTHARTYTHTRTYTQLIKHYFYTIASGVSRGWGWHTWGVYVVMMTPMRLETMMEKMMPTTGERERVRVGKKPPSESPDRGRRGGDRGGGEEGEGTGGRRKCVFRTFLLRISAKKLTKTTCQKQPRINLKGSHGFHGPPR
jgi:hypothetical protein